MTARILLTHSPEALSHYYGERALAGLQALGEVRLNREGTSLKARRSSAPRRIAT